jgi:integrase
MASVSEDSKGWKIVFYDGFKQRRSIRIGQATRIQAEEFKRRIGKIVSANKQGNSIDESTEKWLAKLPPTMNKKLVNAKLIEGRQSTILGEFIHAYTEYNSDVKPSTRAKWGSAIKCITDYFGADIQISKITVGDVAEFRAKLIRNQLSVNTVNRYCGILKQFFAHAVEKKLLAENPFRKVDTTVKGNRKKFHFIELEDAAKIFDACPDDEWCLIFALCRFGGLRCPSEIVLLRWEDIDWEGQKMLIHAPKTERYEGKETRNIPLFHELRARL